MRSHEWIDRRSLALHEAVAAKLEAHPICCGWLARTSSDGCAPMRPPRPIRNENTGSATGWRLEIHDLAVSQQARRERDLEFVQVLLGERLVDPAVLGD